MNDDDGGYYRVHRPSDPDRVADDVQRPLDDWYAKVGQLVGEFRDKYDGEIPARATAEN